MTWAPPEGQSPDTTSPGVGSPCELWEGHNIQPIAHGSQHFCQCPWLSDLQGPSPSHQFSLFASMSISTCPMPVPGTACPILDCTESGRRHRILPAHLFFPFALPATNITVSLMMWPCMLIHGELWSGLLKHISDSHYPFWYNSGDHNHKEEENKDRRTVW